MARDQDLRREKLNAILVDILGEEEQVYFQPPPDMKILYPAIVYHRDNADTSYADNKPYRNIQRYQVSVIDRNPDSQIPKRVAALPMCAVTRTYRADNLNHDVFSLFF